MMNIRTFRFSLGQGDWFSLGQGDWFSLGLGDWFSLGLGDIALRLLAFPGQIDNCMVNYTKYK